MKYITTRVSDKENSFKKGDLVVANQDHASGTTVGKIYLVEKVNDLELLIVRDILTNELLEGGIYFWRFSPVENSTRQFLGYKLLKDIPQAKVGVLYTRENANPLFYNYNGGNMWTRLHKYLFDDREYFEPVYEERKKIFWIRRIGHLPGFTVEIDGDMVKYEEGQIHIRLIKDLLIKTTMSNKTWVVSFDTVNIGCKAGILMSSLQKLVDFVEGNKAVDCVKSKFQSPHDTWTIKG